jgi:hypothetical protein
VDQYTKLVEGSQDWIDYTTRETAISTIEQRGWIHTPLLEMWVTRWVKENCIPVHKVMEQIKADAGV